MITGCCPTRIAGRILAQDVAAQGFAAKETESSEAQPAESVRAALVFKIRAVESGTPAADSLLLGETISTPAGDFVLEVGAEAFAARDSLHLPLTLQVVDGREALLYCCEMKAELGKTLALDLPVPAEALGGAQPVPGAADESVLLAQERVRYLRETVRAQIEQGLLPSEAQAVLDRHLQPLEWAEALLPDARQVLEGSAESAERLRAVLLSLLPVASAPEEGDGTDGAGSGNARNGGAVVVGASTSGSAAPVDGGGPGDLPEEWQLVRREALVTLVAAATWAAVDPAEAQAMLDALALALSPRYALDLIMRASLQGVPGNLPGVMRPLMGGPGPGFGIPGGVGPGLPAGPGIPGWPGGLPGGIPGGKKKDQPPVGSKLGQLVPDLIFPINDKPTQHELCLLMIPVTINRLQQSNPKYEVRAISNPMACPGEVITLTGVNFGATGRVIFPGRGLFKRIVTGEVLQWTDTEIRVRVPQRAAPGMIRLQILIQNVEMCGKRFGIYRLGTTVPYFNGGIPQVHYLWVDGEYSDLIAEPGEELPVQFETSVGTGVIATVTVFNGSTSIFTASGLPGGVGLVSFRTPSDVRQPTDLRVVLRVQNHCGQSGREVTITVAQQPRLEIRYVEVTQAIQRLDNTVRLAARRRTMLRVYIITNLNKFAYDGSLSYAALTNLTGSVTIWRDSEQIAVVPPMNAPFTGIGWMMPTARTALGSTLNFNLPWEMLTGPLRLDVRVWVADPKPKGLACHSGCTASQSLSLNFEPTRGLSLVRILIKDDSRGRPAPSLGEWQAALNGARARFPVPEDGWDIRVLPGFEQISMDNDLSDDDGWDDVLEDLDDVAGDSSESWNHRWAGLLPAKQAGDSMANLGMARNETVDRPWPLSNDYLVFAALAGRPDVFAHELGHTFNINHAGCADAGNSWPEDVDASLPAKIEDYGVDLFTLQTFQGGVSGDLMGYCDDFGLWPSIVLWHRFMDRLK